MTAAAAVAQAAKPAAQPAASAARHEPSQGSRAGFEDRRSRDANEGRGRRSVYAARCFRAAPAAQDASALDLKVDEAVMPAKVAAPISREARRAGSGALDASRATNAGDRHSDAKLPDLTIARPPRRVSPRPSPRLRARRRRQSRNQAPRRPRKRPSSRS